jgi:hypothetical protein
MLSPTPELPDDVPIALVRLPKSVRDALIGAGMKTVGDVRRAANETLQELHMNRGAVEFLRAMLG